MQSRARPKTHRSKRAGTLSAHPARLDNPGAHAQSGPQSAMARRHTYWIALAVLIVLSLSVEVGRVMAHSTSAHLLDVHAQETRAIGHFGLPESNLPSRLLLAGLALIASVGLRRLMAARSCGRVLALGLSLALVVFTIETAFHSVHHLADPEAGAACSVLSSSEHLSYDETRALETNASPLRVTTPALVLVHDAPQWQIYRPHQGRAPPA
jgi:hypothetical protein